MGVLLVCTLGFIYMLMPAKKKELMLTMDGDENTGGAAKAVSKKAKARRVDPSTQQRPQAERQAKTSISKANRREEAKRDAVSKQLYDELD